MWVPRSVVLASVLMMFIPDAASKPQGIPGVSDNDDTFINQLIGGTGGCKCVPLLSCCDDKGGNPGGDNFLDIITQKQNRPCGDPIPVPNGGASVLDPSVITLKQDKPTVDMQEHKNSQCDDILEVCCDKECPESQPPAPCPAGHTPAAPVPSNQCGIRNTNGIGIEMTGMDGRQAQLNEFPWMAGVLEKDDTFVAGGSLVHKRVVLTAGHKVYNLDASNLVARLGDWDLNSTSEPIPAQTINVVKIVFHKDFQRPTMVNNVALLILESDAVLSDTVMPICMPKPGQTFDGTDCLVTGWGKDMFGKTGRYQTIMKKLTVPAVGHRECQDKLRKTRLGSTFDLHESFNCAGGQKEDPCTGDGGSPLVCPNPENPNEYVQMGVVSWGIGCGIIGNPGVYGSIPKTEDWILRTIQAEVGTGGGGIGFDERVPN